MFTHEGLWALLKDDVGILVEKCKTWAHLHSNWVFSCIFKQSCSSEIALQIGRKNASFDIVTSPLIALVNTFYHLVNAFLMSTFVKF
jgi:hypothetical protein